MKRGIRSLSLSMYSTSEFLMVTCGLGFRLLIACTPHPSIHPSIGRRPPARPPPTQPARQPCKGACLPACLPDLQTDVHTQTDGDTYMDACMFLNSLADPAGSIEVCAQRAVQNSLSNARMPTVPGAWDVGFTQAQSITTVYRLQTLAVHELHAIL